MYLKLAALATITALAVPASAYKGRLQWGTFTARIATGDVGCIGANMTWTVSGECGSYGLQEFSDEDANIWYELRDENDNKCGYGKEYFSCVGKNNYLWLNGVTKLIPGSSIGQFWASGMPKDCEDAFVVTDHTKHTSEVPFNMIWHPGPAPANIIPTTTRKPVMYDTCTSTSTITPTTGITAEPTLPAFWGHGRLTVEVDGKKNGCLNQQGRWTTNTDDCVVFVAEYGFAPSGTFGLWPPGDVNDSVGLQWTHKKSQPKHSLTCAHWDSYPADGLNFFFKGDYLNNPLFGYNYTSPYWYANHVPSDGEVQLLRGEMLGSLDVAVKIGWDYVQTK